jgi:hypothetical protein
LGTIVFFKLQLELSDMVKPLLLLAVVDTQRLFKLMGRLLFLGFGLGTLVM